MNALLSIKSSNLSTCSPFRPFSIYLMSPAVGDPPRLAGPQGDPLASTSSINNKQMGAA